MMLGGLTMAARYGLWDVESGNNLGFYPTQEAALAVVRQELRAYGRESVSTLALDCDVTPGGGALVAEGAGLIALAEAAAPPVLSRQNATDDSAPEGQGRNHGRIVAQQAGRSSPSAGKSVVWQDHYKKSADTVPRGNLQGPGKPRRARKK